MNIEQLYDRFCECTGVSTDTRSITKGMMYFALKGENFDGNNFAQKAIECGATWAVVDNVDIAKSSDKFILVDNVLQSLQALAKYHRHTMKATIIGLTGSNGKTTTKELLQAVLSKKFNTLATIGNLNNHIGVPLTLLRLKPEHQIAVIEMGANHQGEIAELSEIADPDLGLITNIGKAHMGTMGGIQGIIKTKTELFDHLRHKQARVFVSSSQSDIMHRLNNLRTTFYGRLPQDDYQAEDRITDSGLLEIRWWPKGGTPSAWISTNLVGAYNFDNALAAIAIGTEMGASHQAIAEALTEYVPSNNRSQLVKVGTASYILDAYNANPSSMAEALNSLSIRPGHKGVVLGEMLELGSHSDDEHRQIIQQTKRSHLDFAIFVGPGFMNVASEWPEASFCQDVSQAKLLLQQINHDNHIVLIKGSRRNKLEQLLTNDPSTSH